ncbi:BspA family leucine-rich repeat surface protein [Candidatus Saccharibacteria bacterium]|nr:BspA family leucine-rich repeat surface protein [Candidatus Saccharibacteria bacterium]
MSNCNIHHKFNFATFFASSLTILTAFSIILLSSSKASADSSSAVDISVTVPASCSLTVSPEDTLSTTITPGNRGFIGTSTITSICNDPGGLAVYAIGYTNNIHGNNNLSADIGGNTIDIASNVTTGAPLDSEWNMTINAVAGTYAPTIVPEFDNAAHIIPTEYTKVAYRDTMTDIGDNATGAKFTADFNAYIKPTQAAGTYNGKVKFTLVHPSLKTAPASRPTTLDTGMTVNAKMKTLAAGSTKAYTDSDSLIKSINVHLETPAPSGFTPSDANTVSSATSEHPIYIVFDNTNSAGVMHFYTEGDRIVLSPDSSAMFLHMSSLSDFSDLSDWDTSQVTSMGGMFSNAGTSATTFSLDLSDWDTSQVTIMQAMFNNVGFDATSVSLDLSGWDTSQVTDMFAMFVGVGQDAASVSLDLSGWDTSRVTTMGSMFTYFGTSATTWSVSGLSGWDTSQVTDMSNMFTSAGRNATTFSLDLSGWDTSRVTNMDSMFLEAGKSATNWSIGNLSGWDTSRVTSMNGMFNSAGQNATTFSLNLSGWDASQVTDMGGMFVYAGQNATTFSLNLSGWDVSGTTYMNGIFALAGQNATTVSLDLSGWDTSQATDMGSMFVYVGYNATTFYLNLSGWDTSQVTNMNGMLIVSGANAANWTVIIPQTNGNNISNATNRLYGKTTSVYSEPPSGKSFTLAQ